MCFWKSRMLGIVGFSKGFPNNTPRLQGILLYGLMIVLVSPYSPLCYFQSDDVPIGPRYVSGLSDVLFSYILAGFSVVGMRSFYVSLWPLYYSYNRIWFASSWGSYIASYLAYARMVCLMCWKMIFDQRIWTIIYNNVFFFLKKKIRIKIFSMQGFQSMLRNYELFLLGL